MPQGTVLAPTLFLIFINVLGDNIESQLGTFADDAKLKDKVKTKDDHDKIKKECDKLFKWADENNMMFNTDKFQSLPYGNNTENHEQSCYCNRFTQFARDKK